MNDPERAHKFEAYYRRAFSGETFREVEYSDLPFELWSELSFFPIYENSVVIGTACFSKDITERKKNEDKIQLVNRRISSILNTIPANIALLDEKGFIVDVNEAWKKFADENDYSGDNYCIGDNYISVCRQMNGRLKADSEKLAAGIDAVLQSNLAEFVFEYPCHAPHMERWFRMVVTPLQEQHHAGAVVMHIDISEIRRLENERLEEMAEEQKKITRAMLQGEEKERTRLGKELHDNISQLLAAIKMKLGFCIKHFDKALPIVEECTQYVQEALTEARNLSHKMVIPRFDENSFAHYLESAIRKYENPQRIMETDFTLMDDGVIPAEIKETMYRIVQEQLNNIEKHAKATKVYIQVLTKEKKVTFVIRDNGVGFDKKKHVSGIGLSNILNRAESYNGRADIISEPGRGCILYIEIPLPVSK